MKTAHVCFVVSVFHPGVGADVDMRAFHLGSLNGGSVDKITHASSGVTAEAPREELISAPHKVTVGKIAVVKV